ncbi:uncharacterized protein K452DRAFT_308716 [Aplosporella prunicola CBS 121167]|uniref:Uncharacterized protein n=1 Tax=Aplosporella prunicola CBS 121167 TaxID=1176127 RepID=A0A6A6BGH6_9PEZI|nr:uncharacterized protein K452DRAFT_308716 [Aplosporella prunicola CBS 121167]KAF2141631.1 hypothetical protein K452DRAFT_308716 [Aplosporella prunicola CBS 121167]
MRFSVPMPKARPRWQYVNNYSHPSQSHHNQPPATSPAKPAHSARPIYLPTHQPSQFPPSIPSRKPNLKSDMPKKGTRAIASASGKPQRPNRERRGEERRGEENARQQQQQQSSITNNDEAPKTSQQAANAPLHPPPPPTRTRTHTPTLYANAGNALRRKRKKPHTATHRDRETERERGEEGQARQDPSARREASDRLIPKGTERQNKTGSGEGGASRYQAPVSFSVCGMGKAMVWKKQANQASLLEQ